MNKGTTKPPSEREFSDLNFSKTTAELMQLLNKQQQEKFSFSKLKILLPYLQKYPGYMWIVALTAIISAVILLPVPILTKLIIDKYIAAANTKMIIFTGVIFISLYVLGFVVKVILNYFFSLLNNKLLMSIKQDLIEKIIDLPISFFSENQSGYLVSRINEINQLGSMFSIMFLSLVVSGLTFICSFIILGFIGWQILLLSVLFLPVQFLVVRKFSGGLQNISKAMLEKSALLNKNMQEVVTGIQTVKTFYAEGREKNKINSSINSLYKSSFLQNVFLGISQEIISMVSNFSNLLVLIISAFLIINKQFTIGLYIACLQYVNNIFRPVQAFASSGMIIQPVIAAINRINEYFDIIGEDRTSKRDKNPDFFKGKVVFQDVSFFYEKNKYVLHSVSLTINPGEKVVISGANGTGKTTLIKLLLQFHLPHSGTILIDNLNATTISLASLRKRMGFVSQDVFLFNDTIKNNLVYGCDEFSEADLESIIKKFCPFIEELPDGINTVVGERGDNLSGGQKQAISIVRSILKQPDILLFDEGNSNLDNQAKNTLIELVDKYFKEKTCIFISHDNTILNRPVKNFIIENSKLIQVN